MITEQLSTQQTVIPEVFQELHQQAEQAIQQQEFPIQDVRDIRLLVYQQLLARAIQPLADRQHHEPAIQHRKALQQRLAQAIQQERLHLVQPVAVLVRLHHQAILIALRVLQVLLLIQVDRVLTLAVAVLVPAQVLAVLAQAAAVPAVAEAVQEVLAEAVAEEEDNLLCPELNTKVVRF